MSKRPPTLLACTRRTSPMPAPAPPATSPRACSCTRARGAEKHAAARKHGDDTARIPEKGNERRRRREREKERECARERASERESPHGRPRKREKRERERERARERYRKDAPVRCVHDEHQSRICHKKMRRDSPPRHAAQRCKGGHGFDYANHFHGVFADLRLHNLKNQTRPAGALLIGGEEFPQKARWETG
jgi:hypothetical protein